MCGVFPLPVTNTHSFAKIVEKVFDGVLSNDLFWEVQDIGESHLDHVGALSFAQCLATHGLLQRMNQVEQFFEELSNIQRIQHINKNG